MHWLNLFAKFSVNERTAGQLLFVVLRVMHSDRRAILIQEGNSVVQRACVRWWYGVEVVTHIGTLLLVSDGPSY